MWAVILFGYVMFFQKLLGIIRLENIILRVVSSGVLALAHTGF
jgi:hypothetical protein